MLLADNRIDSRLHVLHTGDENHSCSFFSFYSSAFLGNFFQKIKKGKKVSELELCSLTSFDPSTCVALSHIIRFFEQNPAYYFLFRCLPWIFSKSSYRRLVKILQKLRDCLNEVYEGKLQQWMQQRRSLQIKDLNETGFWTLTLWRLYY